MGEYHLSIGADRTAHRRKWSRRQVDDLVAEFFRLNCGILPNAPFAEDLDRFFEEKAKAEEIAETTVTLSLSIERIDGVAFRCIVFETDHQGCSCVKDIAEDNRLSDLKRWFKKAHPDCRAVYIGNGYRFVDDPFLTATCLLDPIKKD